MPEEVVDLVDESDRVIGQELKRTCHERGLRHRGAAILVFKDSSRGELLMQYRSATKDRDPHLWCQPGGHVGTGESYQAAAEREVVEEIFHGVTVPKLTLSSLFTIRNDDPNDREFDGVFALEYPGPFSPDPEEVEKVEFFPVEKLAENVRQNPKHYTATFRLVFQEYLRRQAQ